MGGLIIQDRHLSDSFAACQFFVLTYLKSLIAVRIWGLILYCARATPPGHLSSNDKTHCNIEYSHLSQLIKVEVSMRNSYHWLVSQ